jgi:hypothetical protein
MQTESQLFFHLMHFVHRTYNKYLKVKLNWYRIVSTSIFIADQAVSNGNISDLCLGCVQLVSWLGHRLTEDFRKLP